MVKKLEKKLPIHKAEKDRTPREKLFRDIVCFAVVIYVGILSFAMVNSQIKLTNAQTDLINSNLNSTQVVNLAAL